MKRKLLSLLLALALLLTLLPQAAPAARAEDAPVYSGECGDNLTWTFAPDTGTLTIEGSGDMWDFWGHKGDGYITNTEPWNAYCDVITKLALPEGLTSIGDVAFNGCWRLQSAVIPGTVTSIGDYAFGACEALREVVIPEGVTNIGEAAFYACNSLSEVVLPGSVAYIGNHAFCAGPGLTAITFLNSSCRIASGCLEGCVNVTVFGYSGSTAEHFAEAQGFPFVSLGDMIAEGVCGDTLTWSFDSTTGVLTIEGEGDMWSYMNFKGDGFISEQQPWNAYKDMITGLSLPEGLTSIGDAAFNGCTELRSAVIPGTVTRIGDYAFGACHDLSELVIPEGVINVGEYAFVFCTSLSEAVLPASVEFVGTWAFAFCSDLRSITFLNPMCTIMDDCLDSTENVTVYGYSGSTADRFAEKQGFSFVSLGDFTAEGVCGDNLTWSFNSATGILSIAGEGDMWGFWNNKGDGFVNNNMAPWCPYRRRITGLSLPEGLTSIGDIAFNGCSNLTSVVIPGTVYRIGEAAFGACSNLRELVISEGVSVIGAYAFDFCSGLTKVVLPASVEIIEGEAFGFCFNLNSITFLNPTCIIADDCLQSAENVTVFGYSGSTAEAFASEQGLRFVPLGDFTAEGVCGDSLTWSFDSTTGLLTIGGSGGMWNYDSLDPAPWYSYSSILTAVSFPAGITSIGTYAFSRCTILSSVSLPEGLSMIEYEAFANCWNLAAIDLPDSLEYIGEHAFYNCNSLCSVTLPTNLQWLGPWAFEYCDSLSSVTFPDSLAEIGTGAFWGCTSLSSVSLPTELEYTGEDAFGLCTSLISVIIPENVKSIGDYAFTDCTSLVSVSFPESLITIEDGAFYGCESLRSVSFPKSLIAIGNAAFYDCYGLCSVNFSEGLKTIGYCAFYRCNGLRSVVLPKSVEKLGEYAFENDSLKTIVVRNPACKVCCYKKTESFDFGDDSWENLEQVRGDGNWSDTYESWYNDTLGLKHKLIVYGPHDAEKETAPMMTEIVEGEDYRYTYGYRYIENCAKTFGYTFYATNVFSDVKEGKFYEIPVAWAYGKGITSGKDETHFAPNETCTRGQVVTFLWNAMGNPAPTITDCPFVDVKPGKFYYDAMLWALETGVTSGKDETHFAPNESCTRGQVVTFIWNAMGKPEPTITDCPFVDVTPGKYYYNAMLWALENGITAGLDETHFGPNQTCTRGQVVTFLYNALS